MNLLKLCRNGDKGCRSILDAAHDAHRHGDDGATAVLMDAYSPLIDEVSEEDELRGPLWLALRTAVYRLRSRRVDDVVKYVSKTLWCAKRDYVDETSRNVLEPRATLCDRRKREGKEQERKVLRKARVDVREVEREGRDRFAFAAVDLRLDVQSLPTMERAALELRLAGADKHGVERALGLSRKGLGAILRNLRKKFGFSDRVLR